ncbi:VOC family protein [Nakamurella flavida]|uniref:VOC family protein n=1 Tax=Nakamurella flavida TaxID=363630 RepID=A0A938YGT8_9ACTN|nr:VOC family protein [Nakamurella flavida]MBM9477425.1 VOC family protein [Nakamurella flavida]MDP9777358.1 putative enzyme related to lactoylglutathione lyase [Nakamurella flavida]
MTEPRVQQLRVVVVAETDQDYEAAVAFYSDALGLAESAAFAEGGDDRVVILDAGRATLEIASPAHHRAIDRVEAEGRPSPRIRLAFEVQDTAGCTRELAGAGADVVAEPVMTPWRSINARLAAPAGLQITLFQETESAEVRAARTGFTRESERD